MTTVALGSTHQNMRTITAGTTTTHLEISVLHLHLVTSTRVLQEALTHLLLLFVADVNMMITDVTSALLLLLLSDMTEDLQSILLNMNVTLRILAVAVHQFLLHLRTLTVATTSVVVLLRLIDTMARTVGCRDQEALLVLCPADAMSMIECLFRQGRKHSYALCSPGPHPSVTEILLIQTIDDLRRLVGPTTIAERQIAQDDTGRPDPC